MAWLSHSSRQEQQEQEEKQLNVRKEININQEVPSGQKTRKFNVDRNIRKFYVDKKQEILC